MRGAAAMGAATFISRIMGLVREQVFAFLFGAGNATDAFNIAFRIPNLLRDLFAEGAMSAALVPSFTRVRHEQGEAKAWRLAGLVFRVLFVTVGVLAVLGILFAPQLVDLYAGAFKEVEGKFELTVRMTRIIFPFFPLVALAAAFMGILNACGFFFLPAFASALFNLGSVVVGVACALSFMHFGGPLEPIEGMAIGVVAGGLVQAFCQLPQLKRAGYRWRRRSEIPDAPVWSQDPALKRMLWMMLPGTVGLAATQLNVLINSVLATSEGAGAVSWLNYAFRLMQFPIGVFGVSIAAATLPRVSKFWVERDLGSIRETLTRSLRQVFAINLPASAGLAFLAEPIIRLIFQYGRFDSNDTRSTAYALMAYAVGLSAYSAVKVLVPAFYAVGNTRIPVAASVLSVAVNLALNLMLVSRFSYWGLALGTSVTAMLNFGFLLAAMKWVLIKAGEGKSGLPVAPILRSFMTHAAIALAMGATCFFTHQWLDAVLPTEGGVGSFFGRLIKVGVVIFEGGLIVALLAKVFAVRDTTEVLDLFAGKLKKKLRRNKS